MLSGLSTAYLFLGGTGAGTIFVVCCLDLFWAHEPFGVGASSSFSKATPQQRVLALACIAAMACLAIGAACLLLDLGRIDRASSLITNPNATYLTFGAFALAVLIVLSVFIAAVRVLYLPIISRSVMVAAQVLACVLAIAVMLYTGMLLQSMGSVEAWDTPLVPCLFVLSSLSCGIAAMLLCAFADGCALGVLAVPRALLAFDAAIVVLELIAAVAYSCTASSRVSFEYLASGDGSLVALWWLGFAFCGLAAPFALEFWACRETAHPSSSASAFSRIVCAALLVLVGGACLRFCVANAGGHDPLQLNSPLVQQADSDNSKREWTL